MSAPVIDFHTHAMPSNPTWNPALKDFAQRTLGEDYDNFMVNVTRPDWVDNYWRAAGLDYVVVLPDQSPITSPEMTTNEEVASLSNGRPHVLPFASINPHMVRRPAAELRRLVEELGFRGLKLYPTHQQFYPNDALVYPIYGEAEDLGIPVLFHTGSSLFHGSRLKYGDPLFLDDVAVDFPRLNLVMAHSGRPFWYDRAFYLARFHENVYMEISGLPPQKLLDYFPEFERNADKIIFGSDWPGVPSLKGNIAAIRSLPISEESKEKILGCNAASLLGLAVD